MIPANDPITPAARARVAVVRAAGVLLARWHAAGCRSVSLQDGRLEPSADEPDTASWAITDPAARGVLVTTVAAGKHYLGWDTAVRDAERELER